MAFGNMRTFLEITKKVGKLFKMRDLRVRFLRH